MVLFFMHQQEIFHHYSYKSGVANCIMGDWIRGWRWDWTLIKWNILITTMNPRTCTHLMVSCVGRRGIQNWWTSWILSFVGYVLVFDQWWKWWWILSPLHLHVWIQRSSLRSTKTNVTFGWSTPQIESLLECVYKNIQLK